MICTEESRAILHLDLDAFFPAVEVLDQPALKGKPVIVGGSHDRGVVSSASYEARKFGIHSAQAMVTAMRLCPHGVFLPVRMSRYKEVSEQVFKVYQGYTPLVEAVSIDEAFLDVTGSIRLFGSPEEMALKIKREIRSRVGLTVSAGVASCKFVAKIASDLHKPDGLTIVPEGEVSDFLEPLPIEKLWGVGKVTRQVLHRYGLRTIGALSRFPLERLDKELGKQGRHLHQLSQGIDDREVVPGRTIKSIGHEMTFPKDLLDREEIRKELLSLATRVSRRLRFGGFQGRTATLKVKYSDFVQVTRSVVLRQATDDGAEIFRVICRLLERTEAGKRPVRLLGIALSQLYEPEKEQQPSLFPSDMASPRKKELNRALDKIVERYGEEAVLPGTLLKR